MRVKLLAAAFAFAIAAVHASQAMAAVNNFTGGTTNYNTAGNWSLGRVPIAGDQANITNGRSAALSSSVTGQPDTLWIGSEGYAGNLNIQSGGNLTVNGGVVVGYAGSDSAPLSTLTLSGGTLNINGDGQTIIGGDGKAPGKLVVSGGTLNVTTTRTTAGDEHPVVGVGGIYAAGSGSVEQSGGTISITENSEATRLNGFGIGTFAGSAGSYTMSGGTLSVGIFTDNASQTGGDGDTEMNVFVGYKGKGTFTQTGGTVNVTRKLTIGSSTEASLYDISSGNGVLKVYGDIHVGDGGNGTLLIGDNSTVTSAYIRLARGNGTSTVTMTGGTLNTYAIRNYSGTGSGLIDVQGGQLNLTGPDGIYTSGAPFTVNLSGGVIDVSGNNFASVTNFNFTGGELRNANIGFSLTQDGGALNVGYTRTWTGTTSTTALGNTITGDYTQNAGSVLFDIGGTGVVDKLTVTGAAALNGTIGVSLLSDYTPTLGASFDLMDFASFSGMPLWSLPTLGSGLSWETDFFSSTGAISVIRTPHPGDANKDGNVNAVDASILAEYWLSSGQGIGWRQGDFTGDGKVDDADAVLMAANWGPVSSASVPEPSALALLTGGLLLLLWKRKAE